jgi:hypothetical protein
VEEPNACVVPPVKWLESAGPAQLSYCRCCSYRIQPRIAKAVVNGTTMREKNTPWPTRHTLR